MNNTIKIEMDLINGIVVVEDFDSDTRVMEPGYKAKDFLLDQIEGTIGFEATNDELQEILDMGYGIEGFDAEDKE